MTKNEPRIILFDIETLPDLFEISKVYFGLSDYPGKTRKAQLSSILCASYKVFGEPEIYTLKAWDYSRWQTNINDDYTILKEIVKVIGNKEVDAVVTHNGVRFDWPFLQTRLGLQEIDFLTEIPQIDTCLLARKKLKMDSNALGKLGIQFFGEDKMKTGGANLWHRIQWYKEQVDLDLMQKYCEQDVLLLEKLFKKLRPFCKNIPNHNLYKVGGNTDNLCPSCGSTSKFHKQHGYHYTKTMFYERLKCKSCGSTFRNDKRGNMPRSV